MDDNRTGPDDELAQFFDAVYAGAAGDDSALPWQDAPSREMVRRWVADLDRGVHRRALVIAAGLGDDAAELARAGFEVVAFDQSPAAMAWAAERHAELDVAWAVADLFEPPAEWVGAFDVVVEVFTIQSIPPERQDAAAEAAARFLAPGGVLMVVTMLRDPAAAPSGPPWPLDPATLARLEGPTDERDPLFRIDRETVAVDEAVGMGSDLQLVQVDFRRPTG